MMMIGPMLMHLAPRTVGVLVVPQVRFRAKREHLQRFWDLSLEALRSLPLSSKTVKARLWLWLSEKCHQTLLKGSLLSRKRPDPASNLRSLSRPLTRPLVRDTCCRRETPPIPPPHHAALSTSEPDRLDVDVVDVGFGVQGVRVGFDC